MLPAHAATVVVLMAVGVRNSICTSPLCAARRMAADIRGRAMAATARVDRLRATRRAAAMAAAAPARRAEADILTAVAEVGTRAVEEAGTPAAVVEATAAVDIANMIIAYEDHRDHGLGSWQWNELMYVQLL